MFSSATLSILVYGSLIWCAISSLALLAMLIRDFARGDTW